MFRRLVILVGLAALLALPLSAAEWVSLGPDGGDVRSLTYDPHDPDRILLGTSAGKLFLSEDGGSTWTRLVRLGSAEDYVLDHILFDPTDSRKIYVSAWSVQTSGGDVFRSSDGGRTWEALPGMHGQSVRALVISPSSPLTLVAGTLGGVFRTDDGGETWRRISPENHAEIRNVESIALDPKDPNVVYAGTWHLPWKTTDGGLTWHSIRQGVIDDSDVFSIIVSGADGDLIYASACSGIYQSSDAGELFHKAQGIPYSARRTRILKQDPRDPQTVYAGTTEGLWRTQDGGRTWAHLTGSNLIINDILLDPRNATHVLLATDRSGVLLSVDGARTFAPSNRGFSHRQVAALLADESGRGILFTGVLNDKEFGGVFVTRDAGSHWEQDSAGLEGRDVFALQQTPDGTLIAGTNAGVFVREKSGRWQPRNQLANDTGGSIPAAHAGLNARVADIRITGARWYAATSAGLYWSDDRGALWHKVPTGSTSDFVSLAVHDQLVFAVTANALAGSLDGGHTWFLADLPEDIRHIDKVTLDGEGALWLATRAGAFRSTDGAVTWQHVLGGLPAYNVNALSWDADAHRLLATSGTSGTVYESSDGGRTWQQVAHLPYTLRDVSGVGGRLFVATVFDGILAQPPSGTGAEHSHSVAVSGNGSVQ